jgi:hypothetical protein
LISGELGTVIVASCKLQPRRAAEVSAGLILLHQRPGDVGGGVIVDVTGARVICDEAETAAFNVVHEGMDFGGSLCATAFAIVGTLATRSDAVIKRTHRLAGCDLNFTIQS